MLWVAFDYESLTELKRKHDVKSNEKSKRIKFDISNVWFNSVFTVTASSSPGPPLTILCAPTWTRSRPVRSWFLSLHIRPTGQCRPTTSGWPVSLAGVVAARRPKIWQQLDFINRRSAASQIQWNAFSVACRCIPGKPAICPGKNTQDEFHLIFWMRG